MSEAKQEISCCHHGSAIKLAALILIVLGLVAICIVSLLREKIVNPNMNQVSVTGQGKVYAKPDVAQIVIAVKTDQVKEAAQAVQQNTEKMNKVISKLKELGIAEQDMNTTNYSLTPNYEYNSKGERNLKGYDVYQEVTIKVRDLTKVGKMIESSTAAGANQVGSISFIIDDQDQVKKQAREEAIAKAKKKADDLASLTGIKLGKLVNVYENEVNPAYSAYGIGGMGGGGSVATPDIQVGQNEIKLEVTLVYQVK
jgi:uncharacterized protein